MRRSQAKVPSVKAVNGGPRLCSDRSVIWICEARVECLRRLMDFKPRSQRQNERQVLQPEIPRESLQQAQCQKQSQSFENLIMMQHEVRQRVTFELSQLLQGYLNAAPSADQISSCVPRTERARCVSVCACLRAAPPRRPMCTSVYVGANLRNPVFSEHAPTIPPPNYVGPVFSEHAATVSPPTPQTPEHKKNTCSRQKVAAHVSHAVLTQPCTCLWPYPGPLSIPVPDSYQMCARGVFYAEWLQIKNKKSATRRCPRTSTTSWSTYAQALRVRWCYKQVPRQASVALRPTGSYTFGTHYLWVPDRLAT